MITKFKKFTPEAQAPVKHHEDDFCHDVYATSMIDHGDGRIEYGTGIGVQLDLDEQVYLSEECSLSGYTFRSRSSIHKTGLILANGIGTIDAGYTGEITAVFYNILPHLPSYKIGDRIGQIHIDTTFEDEFELITEFDDTSRGAEGYGSTGEN